MSVKSPLIKELLAEPNDPGETMEELMAGSGQSQSVILRKLREYRAAGRLREGLRIERDSLGRRARKPVYVLLEKPE